MPIPTEADWGDYSSDLDQKHAHDLFAGHTNQEMQPYFRRSVIERTDELRWMPEIPIRYYMLGFRDFVMARDFEDLGFRRNKLLPWAGRGKASETARLHLADYW